MTTARIARDISYANGVSGLQGRLVRGLETLTGRATLIRRARGYDDEVARGGDFWDVMVRRYGISFEFVGRSLADIPRDGPLVLVANHPFGVLDGLMMGHILSQARGGDFRILAHQVFRRAPELERVILPIDFAETPAAARVNIETRKAALDYLAMGGAIGVFPGGTVSTPTRPFGPPMDPCWRLFTARMVARSGATVVPVFFEGANSRLFHLASRFGIHLHHALHWREFRRQCERELRVHIGPAIRSKRLSGFLGNPQPLIDFLRQHTYALSPDPIDWRRAGYTPE